MLSIIIPAYQDPFLSQTIDSLLQNSAGKIEIIPILDGYTPKNPLKSAKSIKPIKFSQNQGMRTAINAGLAKARGKFIMKCDSHCAFGEGYDKILIKNCAEDWLVIPRRYSLDEHKWQRDQRRPIRDYHFIGFPNPSSKYGPGFDIGDWFKSVDNNLDDTMTFQGSCWVANRKYFMKQVGFLDDRKDTYTPFGGEQIEVGLKYWLKGGANKVVKTTWYAHLSKRKHHYMKGFFTRGYKRSADAIRARAWVAKHWLSNEEPGMIHPFSWLVEKFWPVPTWSEDRKLWVFKS